MDRFLNVVMVVTLTCACTLLVVGTVSGLIAGAGALFGWWG